MRNGDSPPQLSVVLSTLGNYAVLRRVLDGYEMQVAGTPAFEVIVVMDRKDPDPDAADRAIGHRPYPIRRITGSRPGLSANRNTGWRAARAPVVLFTDNDTIPVSDLVSQHVDWHRRFPADEVAILGHVRWAPEVRVTPFMRWLEEGIQFDYPSIDGIDASWAHLYGANSSIKKRFVERVGDWEEVRLPYGYEDLEWAYRAEKLGMKVVYNRDAIVDHLRHDMTIEFWKKRIRRIAHSEYQFTKMHPELDPWFYGIFIHVHKAPPARGRGVWLARFIPRWIPWLGPRVWHSADVAWKQALAPHFLEAWEEASAPDRNSARSAAASYESVESSSGSRPAGPK